MLDQDRVHGPKPLDADDIVHRFGDDRVINQGGVITIQPTDNGGTKDEVHVSFHGAALDDGDDFAALVAWYRHGGERLVLDLESMSKPMALGLLGVFVRQEEGY